MAEEVGSQTEATQDSMESTVRLVGLGASAGGIAALSEFLRHIPAEPGMAFVVVMHLSPDHESSLAEVLQQDARIPVRQVRGRTKLEPDHVYVIPPNRSLSLADGHLELGEFAEPRGRRTPIDTFFRTIAEIHPDGIGILLSGSGTDGAVGMKAIKECGGIIMAQSPDEAEYATMPRSAIATGMVDFVLTARELAEKVLGLRPVPDVWRAPKPDDLPADETKVLREILDHLQTITGRDFRGYKKSTVMRRIGRRMQVHGAEELRGYFDVLRNNPAEPAALLTDLLISVTNFFRDPAAFQALESHIIPTLFDGGGDRPEEIRVWVPACATGEEAYSVAMLLAEHAERQESALSIQVFASDLDSHALAYARDGLYPDAIAGDVGEDRLARFFHREGAYVRVRKELRDMVLFAEHDLLRDPPFSNLNLLTCRNLLIYLERDLQERVAEVFRYALRPGGFLFLGNSEIPPDGGGFGPVDKEHRIYRRQPGSDARDRLPALPLIPGPRRRMASDPVKTPTPRQAAADAAMHRQALETHAPPSVLVGQDHVLLHVSERARRYLQFPAGTPSANILQVTRPELKLDLRGILFQALEKGEPSPSPWIPLEIDGQPRRVQMHAAPSPVADDRPLALVTFLEISGGTEAEDPERVHSNPEAARRIEEAEEGLATARAHLQDLVETSETRQEELRASNEELQSINEEYKSTLEELETSREELQSVNEELRTVNDELNRKVNELATVNDDLRNLMAATEVPTLFLDRSLRVQRFTPALQKIFNIMPVDEGRPLAHITHQLDYPGFRNDCERVLDTLQPIEREVENGGGHHWLARITPYRTAEDRIRGVVATFTDVTGVRDAQRHTQESEERFRALVAATAEIVWTTDPDGLVIADSPSWRAFTGQSVREWLGWGWLDAVHPEDRERAREGWEQAVAGSRSMDTEFRLWNAPREEWRITSVRAVPIADAEGRIREWVGMNTDITEQREAQEDLRRAKAAAEQAAETKSQFLATMSHELRTPLTAVIGMTDLISTDVLGPTNERQKKHLDRINVAAWHLVTIIEEVLSYSRSEAGRLELNRTTVDLASIASEVVGVVELEAERKGLDLRLEGADQPEFLFSDAGKVRQVVTNLVGNAIKFTAEGEVVVRLEAGDEEILLRVVDSGPGIPDHQLEEVFEPFTQGDSTPTRSKGGVGLGLAISRRLARLLGGDIELDTQLGHGSTFTLRLPRDPKYGDPPP